MEWQWARRLRMSRNADGEQITRQHMLTRPGHNTAPGHQCLPHVLYRGKHPPLFCQITDNLKVGQCKRRSWCLLAKTWANNQQIVDQARKVNVLYVIIFSLDIYNLIVTKKSLQFGIIINNWVYEANFIFHTKFCCAARCIKCTTLIFPRKAFKIINNNIGNNYYFSVMPKQQYALAKIEWRKEKWKAWLKLAGIVHGSMRWPDHNAQINDKRLLKDDFQGGHFNAYKFTIS